MLTLATGYFIKVLLSPTCRGEGEIYPVAMWFVAILLDFILLGAVLVVFGD